MKKRVSLVSLVAAVVVGAVSGASFTYLLIPGMWAASGIEPAPAAIVKTASVEKKPLYWVAPMDPNYRRDQPGKSPMGMDLIPVYEEGDAAVDDAGPGTIKISPDVVNNLGVRTVAAERKRLDSSVKTVGYITYDEEHLVHIHPRVEGWIDRLYVKATGDPVEKGQPLYDMYAPALVNAQDELLLARDRKSERLITAAEDRLRSLRVPQGVIDELKKSGVARQTITFFAPQSGVVDNLNVRQGFFVKPGATIMSVGTLDQVWVEAEVVESQASSVEVGGPVTMTLDYLPGRRWQGVVDYVYPTIDPKTRTMRIRVRFLNKDHLLKPNMFAQVVIHAASEDMALLVPKEAVIRSGTADRVVLSLGEGRFKSVSVEVGRFDDHSVEILSGLSEGEKVVSSAQFLLDSESSKTSDFKRMNHGEDTTPKTVWVSARIDSLMPDQHMARVTHEAISAWQWPKMTMEFTVDAAVDFGNLREGMELPVEITQIRENRYEISAVHIPGSDEGKRLEDISSGDMSLD